MAIASAVSGRKLADDTIVFGEVGLGGEIRSAPLSDKRIQEAIKLGFSKAIAPISSKKDNSFVIGVKDLRAALVDHLKK